MVSEFNKAGNIRAFLQLSVCVFRLICELIFTGAHADIVVMFCWTTRGNTDAVKRFSNVCKEILECISQSSQTMEKMLTVSHSTETKT